MCAALCLCVLCGIAVVGTSAASESFSFSLKISPVDNWRSYGGSNIKTFSSQNWVTHPGSYAENTVEVTNNGTTIHLKEKQKYKNAYYLLLPFTMTVKVPAYTCYKVTLSYNIKLQRNSSGSTWYVMEWTDNTDGAAYKRTYSAENKDASGGICRLHSDKKNPCTGSGTVELTFDNLNGSAQKTMTREYAIFVGNSKGSTYSHQLETTFTLSTESYTTTKTVRFDANGGRVSPASTAVTIGKKYGPLPTPNRTGYDFDGWYTEKIGGKEVTETDVVGTNPPTTLYAHWTAKKCLVVFNANGGEFITAGGSVKTKQSTVTYGSKYNSMPKPTRTGGYNFDGWYTEPTGGTKVTSDTTVTTTKDHILYAHWHLTPAKAPYSVVLTMDKTSDYGAEFSCRVSTSGPGADHTTKTTWYECDENGENGKLLTDENRNPTSPKK